MPSFSEAAKNQIERGFLVFVSLQTVFASLSTEGSFPLKVMENIVFFSQSEVERASLLGFSGSASLLDYRVETTFNLFSISRKLQSSIVIS